MKGNVSKDFDNRDLLSQSRHLRYSHTKLELDSDQELLPAWLSARKRNDILELPPHVSRVRWLENSTGLADEPRTRIWPHFCSGL